jgi:hypothetical protein
LKKAKKKRLKPCGSRRLCLFLCGVDPDVFAGSTAGAHDLYGLSIVVDRGGIVPELAGSVPIRRHARRNGGKCRSTLPDTACCASNWCALAS